MPIRPLAHACRHPLQLARGIAVAALVVAAFGACSGEPRPPEPLAGNRAAADARIQVAASVPPAAWVAEQVGGSRVEVTTLLPPGRSPHTWEPAPRELAALSRARVIVIVGHPALPFEERLLAAARRSGEPVVVRMSDGVELLPDAAGHEHGGEGDDAREQGEVDTDARARVAATDPHVWLDPMVMRASASRVAEALGEIDRGRAPLYRDSAGRLEMVIDALDRQIAHLLTDLPERRFLAYHPAWGYFAARYGLVQEAIEVGGKEPGTRGLVDRVAAARERGTRTIFVQASVSGRGARVIAEEIGAEVVTLDPLAADWGRGLLETAVALREALGGE